MKYYCYLNDRDYNVRASEFLTKLTFCSIIQFILYILWIPFVILTAYSFNIYGWAVNETGFNIPINEQCYRLWLLLFSSLILFISCLNFYLSFKVKKYTGLSYYIFGIGLFSWIFIIDLLVLNYEWAFIRKYCAFINSTIINQKVVSFSHLFYAKSWDRLTRNTILYIIALAISTVAFIFVLIPKLGSGHYLDGTFIFNSLSYFTNLTNIACFFSLILFYFWQDKTPNNNHTWTLYMCTYIIVVCIIYWAALFPQRIIDGTFQKKSAAEMTESIWLHAVVPVFFVWFFFNSYSLSNIRIRSKCWMHFWMVNIYPLWYFTYAFFMTFLAKESVYGYITNLNPDAYVFSDGSFTKDGNPLWVLTIIGFGIAFAGIYSLLRLLAARISNNKDFYFDKSYLY